MSLIVVKCFVDTQPLTQYHRDIIYKAVEEYWPKTKSKPTPPEVPRPESETEFEYMTAAEQIINKTAIERKPHPLTGRVYSEEFLEFAASTVLTIKSGAAVFYSRMPLHLVEEDRNSLIPNQLIFADFSGEIGGVPVIDGMCDFRRLALMLTLFDSSGELVNNPARRA